MPFVDPVTLASTHSVYDAYEASTHASTLLEKVSHGIGVAQEAVLGAKREIIADLHARTTDVDHGLKEVSHALAFVKKLNPSLKGSAAAHFVSLAEKAARKAEHLLRDSIDSSKTHTARASDFLAKSSASASAMTASSQEAKSLTLTAKRLLLGETGSRPLAASGTATTGAKAAEQIAGWSKLASKEISQVKTLMNSQRHEGGPVLVESALLEVRAALKDFPIAKIYASKEASPHAEWGRLYDELLQAENSLQNHIKFQKSFTVNDRLSLKILDQTEKHISQIKSTTAGALQAGKAIAAAIDPTGSMAAERLLELQAKKLLMNAHQAATSQPLVPLLLACRTWGDFL
jgi:uncharacterized phage infection (PIP) family protein YhgE